MKPKTLKQLESAAEVVDAFGERAELMKVMEVTTTQAITNCVTRGYFPPHTFLVMTNWLREHGYTAAPSLWRQLPSEGAVPQETHQALPAASP